MTLVEKRLYLSRQSQMVPLSRMPKKNQAAYESVRKPEAATPQMRRFHEFRSSSYRSCWRSCGEQWTIRTEN